MNNMVIPQSSADGGGSGFGGRRKPVFEVISGQPTWSRLSRLATERVAHLVTRSINQAVRTKGRLACEPRLLLLREYLSAELPASILKDILDVCLAKDRFSCHHNPTDCLALELWRVFYSDQSTDVSIIHHEFAFPKTSNYPEIVQNLDSLLTLMSMSQSNASTTSFKLELKQCEIGFLLEERVLGCLVSTTIQHFDFLVLYCV